MKIIILSYISLLLVICQFYSQDAESSRVLPSIRQKILANDMLDYEKLYRMQEGADFLSLEEKMGLYNQYAKVPGTKVGGCILNMFLPGLGNLVIGDGGGAAANFFGFLVSGGVFFGGIGITMGVRQSYSASGAVFGAGLIIGGGLGALTFYINGLVSPFIFSDYYNMRLALSLKIRQENIAHLGKKMDIAVPVLANILPGLGIGSFSQGDPLGGFIGFAGDLGGIITFLVGMASVSYPTAELSVYMMVDPASSRIQELQSEISTWTAVMVTGGIVYGLSKLFGIIRPFWYAADYNKGLVSMESTGNTFAFKPYAFPALVKDKIDMRFGLNLELGI